MELTLEGLQNNSNPKPPKRCQVRGSGRSPGQRDDGSLIGGWRWVGGRVLQPISLLRDVQGPPATCLISSIWNVVEGNPLPQSKCGWLRTMWLPLSWKSFQRGRPGSWKLRSLLWNSLLMGSTVCVWCTDYCSSVTKYLPQITEGRASSASHSESTVHRGREGMVARVSGSGRMASPIRKQ